MSWNVVPIQRNLSAKGEHICIAEPVVGSLGYDRVRCFDRAGVGVFQTTTFGSVTLLAATNEGVCWQNAYGQAWCHGFTSGLTNQVGNSAHVQGVGMGVGFVSWMDAASGVVSAPGLDFQGNDGFSLSALIGVGDLRVCALNFDTLTADPVINCLPSLSQYGEDQAPLSDFVFPSYALQPWQLQVSTFSALWATPNTNVLGSWGLSCSSPGPGVTCTNSPDFGLISIPPGISGSLIGFSDAIACALDRNANTITCWGSATDVFDFTPWITDLQTGYTIEDIAVYDYGICALVSTGELLCSASSFPLLTFQTGARAPYTLNSGVQVACGDSYIASRRTCFLCPQGNELVTDATPPNVQLFCQSCTAGSVRSSLTAACTACGFFSTTNQAQTECIACPAGSVWQAPDACLPCPAGSQSNDGVTCLACPTGSQKTAAAFTCTSCPAFSAPSTGQTFCQSCTAPFIFSFSTPTKPDFFYQGFCSRCPDGQGVATWSSTGCSMCEGASIRSNTSPLCTLCPAGSTANASHTICQPCGYGTVRAATDLACFPCPSGYAQNAGQTACTPATEPRVVYEWQIALYAVATGIICFAFLFKPQLGRWGFPVALAVALALILVAALTYAKYSTPVGNPVVFKF